MRKAAEQLRDFPRTITLGLVAFLVLVLIAIFAPMIAPTEPQTQELTARLTAPTWGGPWLGTDQLGRDVLSRLVYGSRVSLLVGVISVSVATILGGAMGIVAGYWQGSVDHLFARLFDIILSFPTILLALVVIAFAGPSTTNVTIAIAITLIPFFGRVARASASAVSRREYVEAAETLGVSKVYVAWKHILPNVLGPLIVTATVSLATAILIEASLSFLGLGPPPPTPTWGSVISDGKRYLVDAPWISTFAGLAIASTVLIITVVGDGVRDYLDPRSNVRK